MVELYIPIPSPAGAYGPQRLLALALSPDGSKLAISDAGAIAVYVLNPDQRLLPSRALRLPRVDLCQSTNTRFVPRLRA